MLFALGAIVMIAVSLAGILFMERRRYRTVERSDDRVEDSAA